jgi:hypothetical protein
MVFGQNARAWPVAAVAIGDEEAVSPAMVLLPTGELHYWDTVVWIEVGTTIFLQFLPMSTYILRRKILSPNNFGKFLLCLPGPRSFCVWNSWQEIGEGAGHFPPVEISQIPYISFRVRNEK